MKEKTDKLVTWVALGIAILASIFAVVFAMNTTKEGMFSVAYVTILNFVIIAAVLGLVGFFGNKRLLYVVPAIVVLVNIRMFSGIHVLNLIIECLFYLAIPFSIVMYIITLFKENPAKARKTLIVIGVTIVVCLLAFLLASGTDVPKALLDKNGLTEATSKWIGTACIAVYILVIAAIASIIYVECAKMFKK